MKEYLLLVLIFFLSFSFYFKPVNASATDCHVYIDGVCQTWYHFDSAESEEQIQETVEAPRETMRETAATTTEFSSTFLSLAFQFFSIVILFILLIVLLESVLEPK